MKNHHKFSSFLAFFLLSFALFAQSEETIPQTHIVLLKDGSFLKGNLLSKPGNDVYIIQLFNGDVLSFHKTDVQSTKKDSHQFLLLENGKKIALEGLYQQVDFHLLTGYSDEDRDQLLSGAGIHYVIGKRRHPLFGLGAGTGLDLYDQLILPIFLDARGFFTKKAVTPYYNLQFGVGIPLSRSSGIPLERMGILFHPSLGVRVATKRHRFIHFNIGYKMQKATFRQDWGWQRNVDRVTYRRTVIGIGWEF